LIIGVIGLLGYWVIGLLEIKKPPKLAA